MKKTSIPFIMLMILETIAITLWLTKDNIFYLYNFTYIGVSISLAIFLYIKQYRYACWTAMILDFLPYKIPEKPTKKIGWIRYIVFCLSLIFVLALFFEHIGNIERIMFWAFIAGNVLYYMIGIIRAFVCKDNRAFCKYICPITVFLKPMSYFSLIRIKCDKSKCISCGKCKRVCPMGVDVTDNSRKRVNGTESILCMECVKKCPMDAL